MDIKQFRELVVRPTLEALQLWSDRAEELLIATAAHESYGLKYIRQVTNGGFGPARSFYQIEPPTARDVWDRWLPKQKATLRDLAHIVAEFEPGHDIVSRLLMDMRFATVTARLIYWRAPEALPKADDVPGMSRYWGKYWQTQSDPKKMQLFITNYERFVR